jgi:O-acetyl-ADP-ribose deacetylase (regulator of RNase III)
MPIIHDVTGDILKSRIQTLICPVNTVGVMGAGLALAFNKEYNGLLFHYRTACKTGALTTGQVWVYKVNKQRQILCLPTKEHWKNPSKLEWIDEALATLARDYKELGIRSLALPRIGCGKGQLEWAADVRPLVYKHLADLPIPITVFGP